VTKCKVCGSRLRTPEPYRDCPQFERCSVNVCPLDPDRDLRTHCVDDPETRCKVRPTVLREIAAAYPPELLPWFAEQGSDTPQKSIPCS
jgi:hypothetical protein